MVQAYTIKISHQFNDIIEYNKYAIKHSVNKGTQSVYDPSILSKIKCNEFLKHTVGQTNMQ